MSERKKEMIKNQWFAQRRNQTKKFSEIIDVFFIASIP